MSVTSGELRAWARECIAEAHRSGPRRASQLRDCAARYTREAIRTDLAVHALTIGRAQVTLATFRDHLRAQRAASHPCTNTTAAAPAHEMSPL